MIKRETAAPVDPSIILCESASISVPLKVVSIVDSRVSIDTAAAARDIALAAEYTGLLYFLYLTAFTIARGTAVKVYAAIAIVVISW